jgi:hypothetical protein
VSSPAPQLIFKSFKIFVTHAQSKCDFFDATKQVVEPRRRVYGHQVRNRADVPCKGVRGRGLLHCRWRVYDLSAHIQDHDDRSIGRRRIRLKMKTTGGITPSVQLSAFHVQRFSTVLPLGLHVLARASGSMRTEGLSALTVENR